MQIAVVDIDQVVADFVTAWNVDDGECRTACLQASFSSAGIFRDPLRCAVGRIALQQHITECRLASPGAIYELTSEVAVHRDALYFAWALLDSTGQEMMAGCDQGRLDEHGRISQLSVFFAAPSGGPELD